MKKLVLILMMIAAGICMAQIIPEITYLSDYGIGTSFTTELKTRRISKGKVSNPDPVLLYELAFDYEGFYAKAFTIEDLTDYNEKKNIDRYEFEKVEYFLGYKYAFEDIKFINSLKLDAGWTHTTYCGDMQAKHDPENEIYLKLTTGVFLKPGIKFLYDTKNDTFYTQLFASYDYAISEKTTFKTTGNLYIMNSQYNEYNNGFHDTAFTSFYVQHYLQFKTNDKRITWGPVLEYAWALNHDVRDAWKDSSKNNSFNALVGLKLDFKF